MDSPRDWFPAVQTGLKGEGQEATFTTSMSTIEDLSYAPSDAQKSRDRAHMKATGRRAWKTLKGKAEAVWGPKLEAVLIDALAKYQYTDNNKPQMNKRGVRFPYRNRFISQFIYEKTGKNRTHKQVGSRLQQLRDTCEDSRILALISYGSCDDPEDECKPETDVTPPPAAGARTGDAPLGDEGESQSPRQVVVYTQVTAQLTTPSYHIPQLNFFDNELSDPFTIALTPTADPHGQSIPASSAQSILCMFSNVVQLYSSWSLNQETKFVIYEGEQVVRHEKVNLRQVSRPSEVSYVWIYECDLAGSSWRYISASKDPSRITILQSLTPSITRTSQRGAKGRKVSIVYHFEIEARMPSPSRNARHIGHGFIEVGHPSGSSSGSPSLYASYPSQEVGTPSTDSPSWRQQWPSVPSHGFLSRGTSYAMPDDPEHLRYQHATALPHAEPYPPSMGYQGQNYVLAPQGMMRSHSDGGSGEYSYSCDAEQGKSDCSAEPRAAQEWSAVKGVESSLTVSCRAQGCSTDYPYY
ncbi:hypothetical protein D9611_000655 [Ephemerocybe angulata]|uniref:TEA domain-containing protein n=1 Tax=Ephemerocybe angulata TaxID=980116 RepID=A0A8H5F777_9AGAR|nr:hypothetical protein D9611_000655 [Tulosesus angulatus]